MSKRKKIIPTLKELREDLKEMTFKEKVDHIWTYYKEYMLIAVICVLLLCATVTAVISAQRNIVCTGVLVNITATPRGMTYLEEDFAKSMGYDQKWDQVEITYTNFANMFSPLDGEDYYTAAQLVPALIAADRLDYAIMDDQTLDFYAQQELFMDLHDIFSEAELQELDAQGLVKYVQLKHYDAAGNLVETEDPFPVAVNLKNTKFGKEALHGKDTYFCISGRGLDMARRAWEWILAYE
ncbi:MAG: hypothetical protein IKU57_02745 [Oscillospiraceae bacterium]|nr:hypothetical protein [Oscillospiraceae bacterium]